MGIWTYGGSVICNVGGSAEVSVTVADTIQLQKDGTFSLHGTRFETVPGLTGCKVTVSYDLRDPLRVFVCWNDTSYGRANLLDRKANARRPRRRPDGEEQRGGNNA